MSIKADVKRIFSQRPCFFEWGDDDTQSISQGSAVLQCPTDHKASLATIMPYGNDRIVRYNAVLLALLLATAGWKDGDTWLVACFREASKLPQGKVFNHEDGEKLYTLVVDRVHSLTTLTIEEPE